MLFALLPQHNVRLSSSVLTVSSTPLPDVSALRMRDPHLSEDPVIGVMPDVNLLHQ